MQNLKPGQKYWYRIKSGKSVSPEYHFTAMRDDLVGIHLTLSVPVVFLNSPNLSPYFSLNKFERIWLLIFSSLLCLINSHFLITKCHILYVLYNEKLVVDNWLALKGLKAEKFEKNNIKLRKNEWKMIILKCFFTREQHKSRIRHFVGEETANLPYKTSRALAS